MTHGSLRLTGLSPILSAGHGRMRCSFGRDQLPIQLFSAGHRAQCRLAVLPVHTQVSGWRGPSWGTRHRGVVRDDTTLDGTARSSVCQAAEKLTSQGAPSMASRRDVRVDWRQVRVPMARGRSVWRGAGCPGPSETRWARGLEADAEAYEQTSLCTSHVGHGQVEGQRRGRS